MMPSVLPNSKTPEQLERAIEDSVVGTRSCQELPTPVAVYRTGAEWRYLPGIVCLWWNGGISERGARQWKM